MAPRITSIDDDRLIVLAMEGISAGGAVGLAGADWGGTGLGPAAGGVR